MLLFKNKGEIDVRCINTFGASSKTNDKSIGFFGTGLKYAIAILLREGKVITIYSGVERYTFSVKTMTLQHDEFDVVHMNDEALSFTTELGKTWELWQAYRELYCNAADEHGETVLFDDGQWPEDGPTLGFEGETRIYVNGIDNLFNAGYILDKKLVALDFSDYLEVYAGQSEFVYYQNIRIAKLHKPSLYTYNIKHKVDLTEDRTLKNHWELDSVLCHHFAASTDTNILKTILCPKNGAQDLEGNLNFSCVTPGEIFNDLVNELHDGMRKPNYSAVKVCRRDQGDELPQVSIDLNDIETKMLTKATDFCKAIGYSIDDYPIIIVKELGKNILARAENDTIYIAHRTFSIGTKTLAAALVEEFFHITTGYGDNTLSMQNYLFDALMSMGERVIGEPL